MQRAGSVENTAHTSVNFSARISLSTLNARPGKSVETKPNFGPRRGGLWFRVLVSLAGLGLLGVTLAVRGLPSGPVLVEALGVPLVFFGGTVLWDGRKLIKRDHPE